MKNVLRLLVIAALATAFALPAFAQDTAGGTAAASAQDVQAKADLYTNKFLPNYKGTPEQQKIAYDAGKEYLSKFGTPTDESDKKIVDFIQKWVTKYENAAADFNFTKAVNENPSQAFQLSRDLLVKNPDNLKVYLQLVVAGLKNAQSGNKSLNADTANAARKALQLIEQGKTSDVWLPFTSQQEAAPGLNYYLGFFTLENSPAEAATYLLKAAQSSSSYSKEPTTFEFLGAAYFNSEYKPLAAEYKQKYENQPETPESKALFDKINAVTDRVIDSYARAVALTPASQTKAKSDRMTKLTALYKQRHESDAGLQELIASILTKPIMLPGQEPAPTPSPSSSSAVTGTDGTTAKPMATTTAKPAATTAKPAVTPATNNGSKPASTTAPKSGNQKPPVSKAMPAAKGRVAKTTAGH
ncbi:MAG: hypothetical protein QOC61_2097 [Acidobacteriota bacterium]|jgi:hypothetical protein|nr:hypothetical protein [Acidobacteriota bacterium]MDT5263093.1 hypothetical protein [Acidobacteriota bacterium]